jgi:cyclopropane fatty-acyl-phospholipid synthase-like methyltransferase
MFDKPFSQACENNKQAIFDILSRVLADKKSLLEIGSGTGQHAVYFAPRHA